MPMLSRFFWDRRYLGFFKVVQSKLDLSFSPDKQKAYGFLILFYIFLQKIQERRRYNIWKGLWKDSLSTSE